MLDAQIVKTRPLFTIDVTLALGEGEACGLFGASGAGKSTILACIAGAETPDGGHVTLDGVALYPPPLPLHRRHLGYLTQEANLFPHLRVAENILFGLTNGARDAHGCASVDGAQDGRESTDGSESWIAELRRRLELDAIWNAPAHAISGGQARRVALARMLARKPQLVLLDEPFTGLDRNLVRELLAAIGEWHQRLGFTMLVVDHEAEVLERLTPRAIVLENGRTVQDASWAQLRAEPATTLLAELLAPL